MVQKHFTLSRLKPPTVSMDECACMMHYGDLWMASDMEFFIPRFVNNLDGIDRTPWLQIAG